MRQIDRWSALTGEKEDLKNHQLIKRNTKKMSKKDYMIIQSHLKYVKFFTLGIRNQTT